MCLIHNYALEVGGIVLQDTLLGQTLPGGDDAAGQRGQSVGHSHMRSIVRGSRASLLDVHPISRWQP